MLRKPANWDWRVRQGTQEGRGLPVIFIILDVSLSQLLFSDWKMRIMPRSDGECLLYLLSVYRLAFFLKRPSWLSCSPCERKMGPPTLSIYAIVSSRRWFHRRGRVWQTGGSSHSVREASSPVSRLEDSRDKQEADSQSSIIGMGRRRFIGIRRDYAWLAVVLNIDWVEWNQARRHPCKDVVGREKLIYVIHVTVIVFDLVSPVYTALRS